MIRARTDGKVPYVCGPLTELPPELATKARRFYEQIADVCEKALGRRAFVPHEHFDPITNPDPTPHEIDTAERHQVCACTSHLIAVASFGPSWGGGIEVEMARANGVPIILLHKRGFKVSRLLRGNPGITATIVYESETEALKELSTMLTTKVSA